MKQQTLLTRLVEESSGQDVVEYALLAAFIGVAGYTILLALGVDIFNTYEAWLDPDTGVPDLWESPEPGGS